MGNSNIADPFEGLTMDQIIIMEEDRYRMYQVHSLVQMKKDLGYIKKQLKQQPERVRANIALLISIVTLACVSAMTVLSIVGR